MGVIDIEYNTDNKELETLIQSIDRPGDFYVDGRILIPMPRIDVESMGMLSFPVPTTQIRSLIEIAQRAPYGKGTDTILDRSVRDCWQIDHKQVRIGGRGWQDTFEEVLKSAADGLGLSSDRLDAQFYKLLIYEEGGFFAEHRDSEKVNGMVATLVITLPTAGVGGDLVVSHNGREMFVDMKVEEPSEIVFAAFYADCKHEIRPVLKGHRLALIFNLCLRASDSDSPTEAPDYEDVEKQIVKHLRQWCEDRSETKAEKLVWLLEHDYSSDGLSFDCLKNIDASVAKILLSATQRANCALHSVIINILEVGTPVNDGYYVSYWDDEYEPDVAEFDMDEVYESGKYLNSWVHSDGSHPDFGSIRLQPTELLPFGCLDDADPDEEWLNEASGNEGVTLERAYRRAALVIWPKSETAIVLSKNGVGAAVLAMSEELKRTGEAGKRDVKRQLMNLFQKGQQPIHPNRYSDDRVKILNALHVIQDTGLFLAFFHKFRFSYYSGQDENKILCDVLRFIGPDLAKSILEKLIDSKLYAQVENVVALILLLSDKYSDSKNIA